MKYPNHCYSDVYIYSCIHLQRRSDKTAALLQQYSLEYSTAHAHKAHA